MAFLKFFMPIALAPANNGSAFAGLTGNPTNGDPHYNITLAFATLVGRFGMIIPVMALAGSLGRKKLVATGAGTFPVSGTLVRHFADRNNPARGRTNLPASANTYPDSGAFPDAKRKAILSNQYLTLKPTLFFYGC